MPWSNSACARPSADLWPEGSRAGTIPPIAGGDGNREFSLHATLKVPRQILERLYDERRVCPSVSNFSPKTPEGAEADAPRAKKLSMP